MSLWCALFQVKRVGTRAVPVGAEEVQQILQQEAQTIQSNLESVVEGTKAAVTTFDWSTVPSQVRCHIIFPCYQRGGGQFWMSGEVLIELLIGFLLVLQVQSGLTSPAGNIAAPFDVFSGNWSLNLMFFGIIGVTTYALATGPKQ